VDVSSPWDDLDFDAPTVLVDGSPEPMPYRGYYFEGQTIRIEMAVPDPANPRTWLLGDEPVKGQVLQHELTGPLQISFR